MTEKRPITTPRRTSTIYVTSGTSALAASYEPTVYESSVYEPDAYEPDAYEPDAYEPEVDEPGSYETEPDVYEHEPVRTRSAAERSAADERATRRAAQRAAGRADAQARSRLRVAPPMPVKVPRAPFVAMLCVLVVAGVVGILVLTARINANQFRLNNLQSQQSGLDQQEQALQQTLAAQEAPGNLVAAAKKLGLVPAGALAYITLPNGKVYGLPQPASSTPSITSRGGA